MPWNPVQCVCTLLPPGAFMPNSHRLHCSDAYLFKLLESCFLLSWRIGKIWECLFSLAHNWVDEWWLQGYKYCSFFAPQSKTALRGELHHLPWIESVVLSANSLMHPSGGRVYLLFSCGWAYLCDSFYSKMQLPCTEMMWGPYKGRKRWSRGFSSSPQLSESCQSGCQTYEGRHLQDGPSSSQPLVITIWEILSEKCLAKLRQCPHSWTK